MKFHLGVQLTLECETEDEAKASEAAFRGLLDMAREKVTLAMLEDGETEVSLVDVEACSEWEC